MKTRQIDSQNSNMKTRQIDSQNSNMKTRQIDSQNGLTMMHKMKKLKIFPLKFINVAKVFTCNTQFKY